MGSSYPDYSGRGQFTNCDGLGQGSLSATLKYTRVVTRERVGYVVGSRIARFPLKAALSDFLEQTTRARTISS